MELSEFLNRGKESEVKVEEFFSSEASSDSADESSFEEIDVQKAVVESLAADKVAQEEQIAALKKENAELQEERQKIQAENQRLQEELKRLGEQIQPLKDEVDPLKKEIDSLKGKVKSVQYELSRMGDILLKNEEGKLSNQVSLLERNLELDDRFEGETREQVIEVLREGRDEAEKIGRLRRAQVLEAVLVSNESTGALAKKRAEVEKIFTDNANVISGTVIEELKKLGLSHKNGEDYLLPSEIIARNY